MTEDQVLAIVPHVPASGQFEPFTDLTKCV